MTNYQELWNLREYCTRCTHRDSEYTEAIISSGVYDAEESLSGLINRISKPNARIQTTDYINLVLKYTVAYILENEKEQPSSERVMNYIVRRVGYVYGLTVIKGMDFPDILGNTIAPISYQMSMLIDIAKTVAVLRDIIEREVAINGEEFIGLDLGSGTGILLLAQHIQARRLGFKAIELTGIELNTSAAERADRILGSLRIGEIHAGDTTKAETLQGISLRRDRVDFISSENVTKPEVPFEYKDPYGRVSREPQFANVQALQGYFPEEILAQAEHFPHILEWGKKGEDSTVLGKGKYGYEIGLAIKTEENGTGRTVDSSKPFFPTTVYPIGISQGVSDTIIRLDKIGEEYLIRPGIRNQSDNALVIPIRGISNNRW